MIKARKLFLIPCLASFLFLIPFAGLFLFMLVIYVWYIKNQKQIHNYFRGESLEINDITDETLEKIK